MKSSLRFLGQSRATFQSLKQPHQEREFSKQALSDSKIAWLIAVMCLVGCLRTSAVML